MLPLATLPSELQESSGLILADNQLWTLNDAGNSATLYRIDSLDGSLLQRLPIGNAVNTDWEELAQDDTHIYIGDFGNNFGNRSDLSIYKINKSALNTDTALAEQINFEFSDQTDFSSRPNDNDYDCEAFFVYQDSLHLFSKNWVNGFTRHYTLPTTPGDHIAQLRDSLEVFGLITAADIDEDGVVALLGYSGLSNFMWLLFDYQETRFFSGNKRVIALGSVLANGQTEGLAFRGQGYGYISSEGISQFGVNIPPKLQAFSVQQWTDPKISPTTSPSSSPTKIKAIPNPFHHQLSLALSEAINEPVVIHLYHISGQLMLQRTYDSLPSGLLDLEVPGQKWPKGIYFLSIRNAQQESFFKLSH